VDPAYRAALAALGERRPWRAESLLGPALADSARRTPWVVLLAAEAASASGRWSRVDSLLGRLPLEGSRAEGSARILLARGALARGDAPAALAHAAIARSTAADAETQGQALALRARAHERLGARDSARAAYAEAAMLLAPVADWLNLRAASLTRDNAARAKYYDRLRTATARRRAAYTEAQILEQTGRVRAAIPLYERARAPMHVMRLRAATARGPAERDRVRAELIAFVAAHSGTPDARLAIEMLDAGRYRLTADEEVVVARSAAEHGPLSRARVGLARAFEMRQPTPEERLFQISVLAESGPESRRQAERMLARIKRPMPHAGRAALERAKLVRRRGQPRAARAALREVVRRYPADTAAAAGALLILAEMATDERQDAAARDSYLTLARRYPTSEHAAGARFDAAILAFAARKHRVAAAEFDSVTVLYPLSAEVSAARFWAGRARAALGDSAGARARWETLLAIDPMSYYAGQAARRLGIAPSVPAASPDTFALIADVGDALARADLLEQLGMDHEARLELDGLAASADSSPERTLAIADAFRARGLMRRAMELGRRAIALGATDARAWRLVYPVGEADLVAAEAAERKVDPALVAAVIRQESSFEPRATSPVGARGLMQVMPGVGKALARAERITPWDPAMLYEPEVNIRLGVTHLRSFTGHYRHPALALAAYNAGPGRVARWSRRPGAKDPELFVERIRFAETQGYVRTVLRSRDLYAALYDWGRIRGAD
jgi:soluble lytic murein transglycosylase